MRNISFALTTRQFIDGTKDVTRRMGWAALGPGQLLCAVKKGMGLRPGEKIERLGKIEIISVRREPLIRMTEDVVYGLSECIREGFPPPHRYSWPSEFVSFFCASHKGCTPDSIVTRIEFRKIGA
jgi:hypothetical protein